MLKLERKQNPTTQKILLFKISNKNLKVKEVKTNN